MKISYHNLKDTKVSLDQLYNEQKQINVHLTNNENVYTLVLVGRDKEPDFMLSSFRGNFFCRSNFGLNRKKYKSIEGIQKAVQRLVNSRLDSDCVVSFTVRDEVYLM